MLEIMNTILNDCSQFLNQHLELIGFLLLISLNLIQEV